MAKMHRLAFPLPDYQPRGRLFTDDAHNLMSVAVNPYNGNAFVRFTAHDYSIGVLSQVFQQLRDTGFIEDITFRPDSFDNFHIPEV